MKPIAYTGDQRFVFVSYSHANSTVVYDLILRMQEAGVRVWYDGGMEPSEQWIETLPEKLNNCDAIIAFITKEFLGSKWCRRELLVGDNCNKPLAAVFLEEVSLPCAWEFMLVDSHDIHAKDFGGNPDDFFNYLTTLRLLDRCRSNDPQPIAKMPAKKPEIPIPLPDPWTLEPSQDDRDFLVEQGELIEYRGQGGLVKVPDGVRIISTQAFMGRKDIRAVILPESVEELGISAFSDCVALEGIILPPNLQQIGAGAFSGCTCLKSVVVPETITILPWNAFLNCKALESVTLPPNLTTIGNYCFCGCAALQRIDLPQSCYQLGSEAFSGCFRLKTVTGPIPQSDPAFAGTP